MIDTDRLWTRPSTLTDEERLAATNNWSAIEAGILAALAHCEDRDDLMLQVIKGVRTCST